MQLRDFIRDNWEEFAWGFLLGLGFMAVIGVNAIALALVTGILCRLGGMGLWGTKAWRRFGVPLAILLFLGGLHSYLFLLSAALTVVLLSIGYGQRDSNDTGSPLGNWWLDRLKDEVKAKWAARATIVIAVWVVWIVGILV